MIDAQSGQPEINQYRSFPISIFTYINMKQLISVAALCSVALTTQAGTIEWPIYVGADIKDANGERTILGHILTGTLSDGTPAVKRIDEATVRYYQSVISHSEVIGYFIYELNCRTGDERAFSFGSLSQQKVMPLRPMSNISKYRTETLPAFKEVCQEAGIAPKAVDTPSNDNTKKLKKRSM